MRHHNANRKFSRVRKVRNALINSLARSLVLHQKIKTTEPKAKELRPFIEKLVTKGKAGTVSARRIIGTKIGVGATKILVDTISKKYEDRKGGFTRITKSKRRLSDGSKMAIIEFV
ncbi:MAG: 50S ribosomal protein L17 [Candidatus Zambryskibacteria bacterium RIFCSPLOWO2_01_FULL_39_39]|uniref:50S ribosomal protein L17 n=1 Tax=Candidatus Zambryskibacteria bacterium RIFCSPLOWO2_01_FULL_39_39 TaxID=1802758 RepID=A0A1G2TXG3_9BACT|nr:MAG: 50S ribosomal protein L17 [Parcubacteria group bacterium GW2011_GWA1_38_7]OHA87855.1 MAG: 50S ribosomal protein L17 [Candidatus Zambryskibacteria bacterium RIFCSPHIGHO2_01_FULL_39_63]OHA94921.1 MAG: 50S ribosomal protein L17 [Candidatus Zambryskibacteria bacterium RIFCSPHIGHO2_02_FULL_39_19]OHA99101.1 MAG: 50S ribosomal protein L17 [Candidatus Zambryskibacteria bacterium RIFCSPHIGHO2_12_FULL_39_21]OHB01863.1 MAG: 50S ribosomal protein L17 [Candidatus Zambryskibacteria bacterium RIFCSPLO